MTYIKLEDVQKILYELDEWFYDNTCSRFASMAKSKINSLPSIDFEEMIKQEIEENEQRINNINSDDIMWEQDLDRLVWKKRWLQELLNKLANPK